MAKRCPRNQTRGPDGKCYTRAQLKKLTCGTFSRAKDSGAALGKLETQCTLPGGNRRVRVCITGESKPGPSINGPHEVCKLLRGAESADRESFYVLYLDSQNKVNGIEEAHKGTVAAVEVHPREVFKGALAANATAIILAHNHPSGSPVQSAEDIALTQRLVEAGNILGLPVLDHVIVARGGCTSIREHAGDLFEGVESIKKRS
jgi:DNA repair protein RadC